MSLSGHRPDSPLSDRQAIAQVVDAAGQIAKVAGLQDPSSGFSWESCNDQGKPPYRGRVAATMVADGRALGAPPGAHAAGTAIHRDGVVARIGCLFTGAGGAVQPFGECRNATDHRADSNGLRIKD